MKQYIFYVIFLTCFFIVPMQCMEDAVNLIATITPDLDLRSVNALLCVNTTFYPGNLADYLSEKTRVYTASDLLVIPLGLNRFLYKNPAFCNQLTPRDYTNALVHYAQTNNRFMFEHIINNENETNKETRLDIVETMGFRCSSSIPINMQAYSAQLSSAIIDSLLSVASENLFRVLILNNRIANPLHVIAHYGYAALVPLALSRTKNINACIDDLHETALVLAAKNNHFKVCEQLLLAGADTNISANYKVSISGGTALSFAVYSGQLSLTKLLLQHNANINGCEKYKKTPLHIAVRNKDYDLIPLLLEHGADIHAKNNNHQCPLHVAVDVMNSDVPWDLLKRLINKDTLNAPDNSNCTPLHLAARKNLYITNLLLIAGANIHSSDDCGNTPLHHAARYGAVDIVISLVNHAATHSKTINEYNAFIDAKNHNGKTALDVGFNHQYVYEFLQSINAETQYSSCTIS